MNSRRQWPWVVFFAALLVVGLGGVLVFGVLDTGDQVASVVSCLVGLAALCVTMLESRRFGSVDEALEAASAVELSTGALERLRREVSTRQLAFPEPLRVPWMSVGGPFAASPDVILGRLPGIRRTSLRLRGDVTTLVDTVSAVPARQVVITGAAGAGKTSAAILLALQIAQEGEVPLLADMVDWAPERSSLNDWLAACLTATRPSSLPVEHARAVAARLIERGTVIPILDGLDDLSPGLVSQVIESIHEWDRPFVLTSRTSEYETAVGATGLTVAKALVVRLGSMPVSEIVTHLTAGRADVDHRWAAVVAQLRRPGPLREVLSTPLMSGMARTTYTHPDSNPTELLKLSNVKDIEQHLLDRTFPSGGDFAWLIPLAHYLTRHNIRELDPCGPLVPKTWSNLRMRVLSATVFTCYFALVIIFAQIAWSDRLIDNVGGAAFWIGLMICFLIVRLATRSRTPSATPFRFRTRPKRALSVAAVFAASTTAITVMSTVSTMTSQTNMTTVVVGIAGTSLAAAAVGALSWGSLTEPVAEGETQHPLSAIRSDGWALLAHFPAPLLGMAILLTLQRELNTFPSSVAFALIVSTLFREQIPGTAWSRWMLRRLSLVRHGIPADLKESLDNARKRGILRATGMSYRFQHAKVQDHLASMPKDAKNDH